MRRTQNQPRRELLPGQSEALLRELHLVSRDGKLHADTLRKLKQVNHLVQLLAPALADVAARHPKAALLDAGAGNAYLGFILYELFLREGEAVLWSVETRPELVQRARERAARLGFVRMHFANTPLAELSALPPGVSAVASGASAAASGAAASGAVASGAVASGAGAPGAVERAPPPDQRPPLGQPGQPHAGLPQGAPVPHPTGILSDGSDTPAAAPPDTETSDTAEAIPARLHLVTALHACDTATDDALVLAVRRNADHVALVPCCQAEVAAQLKAAPGAAAAPWPLLWQHPIHRREAGAHLTNVVRALALEASGYQVTVTELTGWEHSLKNELILGRRVHREHRGARERLRALLAATQVRPKVVRELFPELLPHGAAAPEDTAAPQGDEAAGADTDSNSPDAASAEAASGAGDGT